MILESLRAGLAFLPRAWSRPSFIVLWGIPILAGAAFVAMADPLPWVSPIFLFATLFYFPAPEGVLYALAIPGAQAERGLAGAAARYARLVAVGLLTNVFLAIPGLLIAVVGLGAAYGMAYSHPGFDPLDASTWTASGPVLAGSLTVLGLGGLAMLWLKARVALGAAATVAERRVAMLSTWPMTRGRGWRIVVARLIVMVVVFAIVAAVSAVLRALAPAWANRAILVVSGALLLGLRLPLEVGVLSYFYEHRAPMPPTP